MINQIHDYSDKVAACWIGKAIAGGIGAPYEGVPGSLRLQKQDIYIQPGPNDDLEMQVIWLLYAEMYGLDLTAENLCDAWLKHIKYGMDEYGVAIRNLRRGLLPPFTGAVNNWFAHGMGAAIRSEIWACLFPGNPTVAGHYAQQDAIVDHHGEGVWAEVFLASAESDAFKHGDVRKALEHGLVHVPENSRIYSVVEYVMDLYDSELPEEDLRDVILKQFGSHNFTDCIMNLGFIVAALLYGEQDFIRTVMIAVNFGKDTDCTAATCGAFMGIANGMAIIPPDLLAELDPEVAISPHVTIRQQLPQTFDDMTERTTQLARRLERELVSTTRMFNAYVPADVSSLSDLPCNSWLVFDGLHQMHVPLVREYLNAGKSMPEYLGARQIDVTGTDLDLSDFVEDFNAIDLFSYLTLGQACDNPLLMACANTGLTVWVDKRKVLNYHGRYQEIPAFHRTEGGGTFYYPFEANRKYLIHVRLYNCTRPLRFSLAVGDADYCMLSDFDLKVHNGFEGYQHTGNRQAGRSLSSVGVQSLAGRSVAEALRSDAPANSGHL